VAQSIQAENCLTIACINGLAQIDFNNAPELVRPAGSSWHPIGGYLLGRLALSNQVQGRGLGGELLIAAA
jgi:hypothetical protein